MCDSQEAWWLRKACRRARCRLIKGLADAFEIPVKSMQVFDHYLTFLCTTSSTVKACRMAPQMPLKAPFPDGAKRGSSVCCRVLPGILVLPARDGSRSK